MSSTLGQEAGLISDPREAKILIIQGREHRLLDVLPTIKEHFAKVFLASGLGEIKEECFDLILVDYSVSDMTSLLLYKQLTEKQNYATTPAIFFADTQAYDHRLNAFEIGAADFLTRPLSKREIIRRCTQHIQNRRRVLEDQSIHFGNLSIYPQSTAVLVNGKMISLTQLEYKILHFLLSTPHQVVARAAVYENVWGSGTISSGRLDTQLYNLKKKLADFNGKIKSVNKVGMRILISESTFSQERKNSAQRSPRPGVRP